MSFNDERNAVLLTGDPAKCLAFAKKYNPHHAYPADQHVHEIMMHKAITAIVSLPLEYRKQSYRWLTEHGYRSDDDGDLK